MIRKLLDLAYRLDARFMPSIRQPGESAEDYLRRVGRRPSRWYEQHTTGQRRQDIDIQRALREIYRD